MSEVRHLTVEFDSGSEPIAGQLSLDGGSTSLFVGYLQLIARLEELRSGPNATGPADRSQGRTPIDDASKPR